MPSGIQVSILRDMRFWVLLPFVVPLACCDPAAPPTATFGTIPVGLWNPPDSLWTRVETCSGLPRPGRLPRWYVVPGDSVRRSLPNGRYDYRWAVHTPDPARGDSIAIAQNRLNDPARGPSLAAHEILHANLTAIGKPFVHPWEYFAKKCGQWVYPPLLDEYDQLP